MRAQDEHRAAVALNHWQPSGSSPGHVAEDQKVNPWRLISSIFHFRISPTPRLQYLPVGFQNPSEKSFQCIPFLAIALRCQRHNTHSLPIAAKILRRHADIAGDLSQQ